MTIFTRSQICAPLLRHPYREKAFSAVGAACISPVFLRPLEQYWSSCSAVAQLTCSSAWLAVGGVLFVSIQRRIEIVRGRLLAYLHNVLSVSVN